jgi:hypothetical protein
MAIAMLAVGIGAAHAERAVALQPKLGAGVSSQVGDQVRRAIAESAGMAGVVVKFGSSDLSDTALLFGCVPDQDSCVARMMAGLEVGELVLSAVSRSPGGYLVQVTRHRRGRPRQRGEIVVRAGSDADIRADLAPLLSRLFGGAAPTLSSQDRLVPPVLAETPRAAARGAAATRKRAPSVARAGQPPRRPSPRLPVEAEPPLLASAPATSSGRSELDVSSTRGHRRRKLVVGAVVGGALAGTGVLLWWRGAQKQDEIDAFPDRLTGEQLADLLDHENSAASQHRWGNVMVGAGVGVIAGTALWYWLAGDKSDAGRVSLAPWMTESGAGFTLEIGGPR